MENEELGIVTTLYDEAGNVMTPPDDCEDGEYYVMVSNQYESKWMKMKALPEGNSRFLYRPPNDEWVSAGNVRFIRSGAPKILTNIIKLVPRECEECDSYCKEMGCDDE